MGFDCVYAVLCFHKFKSQEGDDIIIIGNKSILAVLYINSINYKKSLKWYGKLYIFPKKNLYK